ncbi:small nuclear ribonucleoprotein G-like [Hyaena hyaena]|uniref:small nuclear ribonucleoprotein G-like n=1 Tax=Hyaena hyaena TaxID=95912 RepID=UPI001920AF05|nr:small nuclear ribonucleoprotein G-like [Hyaena hyaena]
MSDTHPFLQLLFPSESIVHHCEGEILKIGSLQKLNTGRHVQGILQGFNPFMNLVIEECVKMATSGQQNNIGMVVIRGNSVMLEALEQV